ncbi:SDR family NAD(P)-dependent oxidoreductase [Streptomyces gamaensis]|uniref:SDR family NAD(P)-dependent oxidoreductase n=1 Tax=Streptomyces gamaensis TaxID=1763542 RepID=A0ABW0YS54_9ACTN
MGHQERFAGRVVMVSGAASGIGKAAAEEFARQGALVVAADVNETAGEATVAGIVSAGGAGEFVRTDVSVEDDIDALVQGIVTRHGRLDVAFNNAGIPAVKRPLALYTRPDWDRVIAVNLTGVFLAMRQELEHMLRRGSGVIVNTTSIGGLTGPSLLAPYAAAKAGIIGLTRVAANESARFGIRVNAIAPGYTPTAMAAASSAEVPDWEQKAIADTPMHRGADPLEIARAAVWLCSDDASFVTGQVIAADGGYTVGGSVLEDNPLDTDRRE